MTITMYINYAHVAQQYFLRHFTKYVVNWLEYKLSTRLAWLLLLAKEEILTTPISSPCRK